MKLMAERRTRLSLAVRLAGADAARPMPADALQVRLSGASGAPLTHHAGYWLIMNAKPGKQTLCWTSARHVDGQLSVQVDPAPPHAPVIELALETPPPTTLALASLVRGRVGRSYRQVLALQGGKPPFHFSVEGLPPGLVLRQAAGTIEGVPSRRGTYDVALAVRDVNGTQDQKRYRLRVTA